MSENFWLMVVDDVLRVYYNVFECLFEFGLWNLVMVVVGDSVGGKFVMVLVCKFFYEIICFLVV